MKEILNLLSERVKSHYLINETTSCSVEIVDPITLIVPERLDILIKLYYIESKVKGLEPDYPKYVFSKQVSAITAYTNKENGQSDKDGVDVFIRVFDKLITDFQNNNYDESLSIIPVSCDGIILDGAHRVACAIYFNKKIRIARFPHVKKVNSTAPGIYDYNYFRKLLLPSEIIDLAILQYIKYSKSNLYLACLWPTIARKDAKKNAVSLISRYPIVCEKEVKLSFEGFTRLISQIYAHDSWVGSLNNCFNGAKGKSSMCYSSQGIVTFVLFEGKGQDDTLKLKEEIRDLFDLGKHSIHITDNTIETQYISNIVFNDNSLSFLENANPFKYKEELLKMFTVEAKCYSLQSAKCLWGLKHDENYPYEMKDDDLKNHFSLDDIISNPHAYFFYMGKRFVMPERSVVRKYLIQEINGEFANKSKSFFSRFYNYVKYLYSYTRIKFMNLVFGALEKMKK